MLEWIVSIAPRGVLEFVPKHDTTIQKMLALREDIFPDYDIEHFEAALTSLARVERREQLGEDGRTLFQFSRRTGT